MLGACAHTPPQPQELAQPIAIDGEAVKAQFIRAGFKPYTYRKALYYCRAEQVTGTQFKRQVCLTEPQMVEQARYMREVERNMTRTGIGPKCDVSTRLNRVLTPCAP